MDYETQAAIVEGMEKSDEELSVDQNSVEKEENERAAEEASKDLMIDYGDEPNSNQK